MKSDRELTILAAKAAGLEFAVTQPFIGLQLRNGNNWNPLTDDGDALRLAYSLGMTLECDAADTLADMRRDIVCIAALMAGAEEGRP